MTHIETTRIIVDAFSRGDIPTILDKLADDVAWEHASVSDVPWYRERRGKADVADFFGSLAAVEFLQWEPKHYFTDGDLVLVVIDSDYRVKKNGRRVVYEDCVLLFRYDEAGRLARFGHRADLLAGWLAWHDRAVTQAA
ncbi:MAG: nuclear transport factor 2 family protein [Sphingobium sp.]